MSLPEVTYVHCSTAPASCYITLVSHIDLKRHRRVSATIQMQEEQTQTTLMHSHTWSSGIMTDLLDNVLSSQYDDTPLYKKHSVRSSLRRSSCCSLPCRHSDSSGAHTGPAAVIMVISCISQRDYIGSLDSLQRLSHSVGLRMHQPAQVVAHITIQEAKPLRRVPSTSTCLSTSARTYQSWYPPPVCFCLILLSTIYLTHGAEQLIWKSSLTPILLSETSWPLSTAGQRPPWLNAQLEARTVVIANHLTK
ncbi:hypothetical protein BJ170DRAFT_727395 [Xylariales sp. AK1849]|nr:hypothetical protein BJ170DRAFT_727395 [Xylariales sp. AK1849]